MSATTSASMIAKQSRSIPPWLSGRLQEADRSRIADAVGRAESRTSGEIVPVIARSSSPLGHAGAFTFALIALALWILSPFAQSAALAAGFDVSLWIFEGGALVLSALATALLVRSDRWLRLLVAPLDRVRNVHLRAELEFFESRINSTEAQTGVLLFVSILERRAVVLADEAIARRLPPDAWNEVVGLILGGVREGDLAQGMIRAIEKAGELLALHFPASRHDRNELPNELAIRD